MTHKRIGLMKLKNKRMETVAVRQLRKRITTKYMR